MEFARLNIQEERAKMGSSWRGAGSVVAAPISQPHQHQFEGPCSACPPTSGYGQRHPDFWRQSPGPRCGVGGSYMMRSLLSQESHDVLLEVQRSQALDKAAVSIQRVLRGYKYRCQPAAPSPLHPTPTHVPWAGLYSLNQGRMLLLVPLWG